MKKKIVIKIGGSLLFSKNGDIDTKKISDFCNIIENRDAYDSVIVVCGGGTLARTYINAVRNNNGNEALCDLIGIAISRINGQLLLASLKDRAYPMVPTSIEEMSLATLFKKIIVMGGLQPGQSTTSVALEVAEFINANSVVILTDVHGIFDKDPKKHTDAKLYNKLTHAKLQEIILTSFGDNQAAAGEYRIFDAVSLQILRRSKINAIVMSGQDFNDFKKFWNGEKEFTGTVISS